MRVTIIRCLDMLNNSVFQYTVVYTASAILVHNNQIGGSIVILQMSAYKLKILKG